MKLYWRYKKNGKWTWRAATANDILNRLDTEGELHSEDTRKLVEEEE